MPCSILVAPMQLSSQRWHHIRMRMRLLLMCADYPAVLSSIACAGSIMMSI